MLSPQNAPILTTSFVFNLLDGQVGAGGGNCFGGIGTLFDQIEVTYLTAEEETELVYMREEEKLARDVYLTLTDTWQLPIFWNIAGAKQRHMTP